MLWEGAQQAGAYRVQQDARGRERETTLASCCVAAAQGLGEGGVGICDGRFDNFERAGAPVPCGLSGPRTGIHRSLVRPMMCGRSSVCCAWYPSRRSWRGT